MSLSATDKQRLVNELVSVSRRRNRDGVISTLGEELEKPTFDNDQAGTNQERREFLSAFLEAFNAFETATGARPDMVDRPDGAGRLSGKPRNRGGKQ
jgi:hypothetical protein